MTETVRSTLLAVLAPVLAGGLVLALGACTSSILGDRKHAPDEFTVLSQAPLVVPPDYALRPPRLGAPRPEDTETGQEAEGVVFQAAPEDASPDADILTPGEIALLEDAGAAGTSSSIRPLVNQETRDLESVDGDLSDQIIFWQDQPGPEVLVDPAAESERLRKNEEEDNPPTHGDTPMITPEQKAPLEGIFQDVF